MPLTRSDPYLAFCRCRILLGLPSLLAITLFSSRAYGLISSLPKDHRRRQILSISRWIHWASLLSMLTACAALVTRTVQLAQDTSNYSPSDLFGTSALLVAWVCGIRVIHHGGRRYFCTTITKFPWLTIVGLCSRSELLGESSRQQILHLHLRLLRRLHRRLYGQHPHYE